MNLGADVKRIIAEVQLRFGLPEGQFRTFDGEIDLNIRLTSRADERVLIKISPPGFTSADLDWQMTVLEHVERIAEQTGGFGFVVPRLVRSLDGATSIDVDGHRARVLTWVEGRMLADVPDTNPDLLDDMGRVSAVLTKSLEGLTQPVGISEHEWIAERSDESLRRASSVLPDTSETRRIAEIVAFHEQFKRLYSTLPRSVVHQDLNDHNLMVNPTGDRIAGVIDFNDAVSTIRVADVGIAASYAMRRSGDPLQNLVCVVRGYERAMPLSQTEREVVFPIAVARLAVNWAVWKSRAVDLPTAYGDARSRRTWPVIEEVLRHGLEPAQAWVLKQLEPVREGG